MNGRGGCCWAPRRDLGPGWDQGGGRGGRGPPGHGGAQGVRELDYPDGIPRRVRRPAVRAGPRQRFDPTLWEALDALVDPVTRGDPMSSYEPFC